MLKVREVFEIKGRGTVAVLEPLGEGVSVHVGQHVRRADGEEWTVSGIETSWKPGLVLRGNGKPAVGDALEPLKIQVFAVRTLLEALSDADYLEALPRRCFGCGSKSLPCHCGRVVAGDDVFRSADFANVVGTALAEEEP